MRILPARSRRLIEDRDRGCRFPGCTATRFVEIHHLREWSDGGATDLDNQISLCPFHHDAVGRADVTISGDPSRPDGLVVLNRYGLPVRPPAPEELAPPDMGPPDTDRPDTGPPDHADDSSTYRPPTGETVRWSEIEVPSDRELQDTLTPRLRLVADSAARPGPEGNRSGAQRAGAQWAWALARARSSSTAAAASSAP